MVPRRLARSLPLVSPIGFGAFKIGRNQKIKYAAGFELPSEAAVERLLNGVLDLGISLIDTAPAYGLSEERIGRAISHRRDSFVLCTKVGETFVDGQSSYDFSAAAVEQSVHRSLRLLRTDVLDVVLVHAPAEDVSVQPQTEVVPTLQRLRQRGLIKALGFSGKTVDGATAALRWADVLMVEYHPDDCSHAGVMGQAAECGIGVLVKKGLAAGRLHPAEAIPFVLRHPAVSSMVIGTLRLDHLRENIRDAESVAPRTSE
jgi:aryl-alcohol dehydrogenase-like predicted oxidoreductase